ncbi:lysylphosphatidylglycerol synthase transmembrane domain-containing protein [Spirillospora sp. NPDC029432]|uniref:lysylphosphatidylglycerol synthase transmembrane domain-containing protein n=1 Tax=Spirillospora sp. NPDC029432 TaxID=3154599 RepID=UPI00345457B2
MPSSAAPPAPRRRPGARALVQWGLGISAIVLLVAFRDRLPDFGAMWDAAARAHPAWILLVVMASAISMGAFARLQRRLLRIGGVRLTLRRAIAVTYAGNALSTTLPAGPAVSVVYTFRQFRHSGATAQLATAVILAGGVITTAAYSAIALLALLAAPQAREAALAALLAPAVLAAAAALILVRRGPRARLAAAAGRALRALLARPRIAPHVEGLRDGRRVLRPARRDWAALAALALVNWVFDILALFAAAQAVGIDIAPHVVALAYFAAQAAGSVLPLLPGGLGAIESSMAAALVALGATLAPAGAAVGLYRLVSYVAVVAVGWLAWLGLHEGARLSARTRARVRARLTVAGRAVLAGLSAAAMAMSPYAAAQNLRPPGTRRP